MLLLARLGRAGLKTRGPPSRAMFTRPTCYRLNAFERSFNLVKPAIWQQACLRRVYVEIVGTFKYV
jgi:hypothetical protein